MNIDLSIVIVSWNTRDLLAGCLASLPGAVGDLGCEILVADNASADGTPAMVRADHPDVRLLETGANLGFTGGNNTALPLVRGERVLLLNPDTVCPPGSLAALCACLDALPDAGAVGPCLVDEDGHQAAAWGDFPRPWHHWRALLDPALLWLPRRWREPGLGRTADSLRHLPRPADPTTGAVPVDYVKGACLLMRGEALRRVGLLDERFFMYFEETDWCRRALALGLRTYLCPSIAVAHLEGRATGLVSAFSLRQFQHSYRLYLAKHEGVGAIVRTRRAQRAEYTLKARLRGMLPGPRNRALAAQYATIAGLQDEDDLAPTPPDAP